MQDKSSQSLTIEIGLIKLANLCSTKCSLSACSIEYGTFVHDEREGEMLKRFPYVICKNNHTVCNKCLISITSPRCPVEGCRLTFLKIKEERQFHKSNKILKAIMDIQKLVKMNGNNLNFFQQGPPSEFIFKKELDRLKQNEENPRQNHMQMSTKTLQIKNLQQKLQEELSQKMIMIEEAQQKQVQIVDLIEHCEIYLKGYEQKIEQLEGEITTLNILKSMMAEKYQVSEIISQVDSTFSEMQEVIRKQERKLMQKSQQRKEAINKWKAVQTVVKRIEKERDQALTNIKNIKREKKNQKIKNEDLSKKNIYLIDLLEKQTIKNDKIREQLIQTYKRKPKECRQQIKSKIKEEQIKIEQLDPSSGENTANVLNKQKKQIQKIEERWNSSCLDFLFVLSTLFMQILIIMTLVQKFSEEVRSSDIPLLYRMGYWLLFSLTSLKWFLSPIIGIFFFRARNKEEKKDYFETEFACLNNILYMFSLLIYPIFGAIHQRTYFKYSHTKIKLLISFQIGFILFQIGSSICLLLVLYNASPAFDFISVLLYSLIVTILIFEQINHLIWEREKIEQKIKFSLDESLNQEMKSRN